MSGGACRGGRFGRLRTLRRHLNMRIIIGWRGRLFSGGFMDNWTVAQKLIDYANFLEGEEPKVYRVRAYRRAAQTVLALEKPVAELAEARGRDGLEELPGIGPS